MAGNEVSMEKVYKTMKSSGIISLVVGISVTVIGCITGAFMITTGARLLNRKNSNIYGVSQFLRHPIKNE